MKKINRVLSMLLSVLTVLGTVTAVTTVTTVSVSAAADSADKLIEKTYVQTVYNTPEEKLATMTLMRSEYDYELYVDAVSGEIATKNVKTGDILFSNPYDVASSSGSANTKKQILSQIAVSYTNAETGKGDTLYSFEEAAMREQIKVYNQKKSVRVEYTIGREESRKLIPRWIPKDRFDKLIMQPIQDAYERGDIDAHTMAKVKAYYTLYEITDTTPQKVVNQTLTSFPICAKMAIYVFDPETTGTELNRVEGYIKQYCEEYTFEEMEADHETTGYVETETQYPVFKLALEYSLTEDGLTVRLPCNGLRYDMSAYRLESISILPYMGAGNSKNGGYNFYPDGSGSLFDFEKLNTKTTTIVKGKVYGLDYAYHEISGATYQKTIRYPVYGSVANERFYNYTYSYTTEEKEVVTETVRVSATVKSLDQITADLEKKGATLKTEISEESYSRGYLAVIEAGDSLAEISTYHAGNVSDYNTMMNYFNPKPKDSYDIADSISVANSSTWTVVSDRKYTDSLTIQYIMLTDSEKGDAVRAEDGKFAYYDATWLGMAEAYRDYLVDDGSLSKLDLSDVNQEYIPLYLEVFGAMETQQTFLTIPVDVMTPLTTFEDIQTIYNELSAEGNGVKNINFKMTGFANGGLYYTVPSKVKWEKAVGGKSGFKQLIEAANAVNEKGDGSHLGLFPDFDFAYIQQQKLFDGVSLKKDAVKTIDNRYTSFRQYSATQQDYVSFYQLAISPSRYEKFYTKFLKNYAKYDIDTLSVASLGTTLNSDFDEDEPYNREDDKNFTLEALKALSEKYSLMSEGANAYSWRYLDYILNVDLESSRYVKSAASVPFIGAVLHGYMEFAGTPTNEEGDTDHAMLRSIENGAALYFILSYQNTDELKDDIKLSQYYSVQYEIWKEDVVKYYNELNEQLKDVQTKEIVNHEFLVGERVLDMDELLQDIEAKILQAEITEENRLLDLETEKIVAVADAWNDSTQAIELAESLLAQIQALNETIAKDLKEVDTAVADKAFKNVVQNALNVMANEESEKTDIDAALKKVQVALDSVKTAVVKVGTDYEKLKSLCKQAEAILTQLDEAVRIIQNTDGLAEGVKANRIQKIQSFKDAVNAMLYPTEAGKIGLNQLRDEHKDSFNSAIGKAIDALNANLLNAADSFYENQSKLSALQEEVAEHIYTEALIREDAVVTEEKKDDDKEEEAADDKYVVDNNQIVAVTYGDRDATTHEKTAYKTFLLNYNNFAVKVNYTVNGKTVNYTIPAGEYITILY